MVINPGCTKQYEPSCATITNNPGNLWLKTTKVYFLSVFHMLHS